MAIPKEKNPLVLFDAWYAQAEACEGIDDHTAVALATADKTGIPENRMVLLKGHDETGFVFYTNLTSPKAQHLMETPHAALCFYWMPLGQQVRIRGSITPVSDEEADAYFASRPKQSQLGAWASKQSQPITSRFELERRVAKYAIKFGIKAVPRPDFWSGFRLKPEAIEFWLKLPYRLHDRVLYTPDADGGWLRQPLFP